MKNVKKLLGLVLAIVLLATLTVAVGAADAGDTQPVSTNLITNGDFEETSLVEGTEYEWADNWKYNATTKQYILTTLGEEASTSEAKVHTKKKAIQVTPAVDEARWISQEVTNLVPGRAYRASAWVCIDDGKSDTVATLSGNGVELRISKSNSHGTSEIITSSSATVNATKGLLTTDEKWVQVTCSIVMPAERTNIHVALCTHYGSAGITVYWDDVTFTEVASLNGGFETTYTETLTGAETCLWAEGWSLVNAMPTTNSNTFYAFLGEQAEVSQSAEGVHSGSYALKLTNTEDSIQLGTATTAKTVKNQRAFIAVGGLTVGETYRVSAYSKAVGEISESWFSSLLVYAGSAPKNLGLGSGSSLKYASSEAIANVWQEIVFYFTATEESIFLVADSGSIEKGTNVYFDDISISSDLTAFYDSKANRIEGVTKADTITVKMGVVNTSADAVLSGTLLLCVYEDVENTPQLVNVTIGNSTEIDAGEVGILTGSIAAETGQYIKAMVFESANGFSLSPIGDVSVLPAGA